MGAILAALLLRLPREVSFETEFNNRLPAVLHRSLTADDIAGRAVFVIGDVHGCLTELKLLLQKVYAINDNTLVVFCGDIINKGPMNLETLRFVRDSKMPVVRGNHEEHVLSQWYKMKKAGDCRNLKEKYHWIEDLTEEDISYLHELPYTLSIPSCNAIVVHAGLYPWRPLQLQEPMDMTLMRNIQDVDETLPKTSKYRDCGQPWASLWQGPEHVYFGHDACRGLQRYRFATGLDTGCLYGGRLTGVFLTGDKLILSQPAAKVYRKPKES